MCIKCIPQAARRVKGGKMDYFGRLKYLHRGTGKKPGSKTAAEKERKSKDGRGTDPEKNIPGQTDSQTEAAD